MIKNQTVLLTKNNEEGEVVIFPEEDLKNQVKRNPSTTQNIFLNQINH